MSRGWLGLRDECTMHWCWGWQSGPAAPRRIAGCSQLEEQAAAAASGRSRERRAGEKEHGDSGTAVLVGQKRAGGEADQGERLEAPKMFLDGPGLFSSPERRRWFGRRWDRFRGISLGEQVLLGCLRPVPS